MASPTVAPSRSGDADAPPDPSAGADAAAPTSSSGGRPAGSGAVRRALAIGLAAITVGLVGLAAASGNPVATSPYVPGRVGGRPQPADTQLPTAAPSQQEEGPPEWLLWLFEGFLWLCAAAILIMLVVLSLRLFVGRTSGLIRRRVMEPEEIASLTGPTTVIDMLGRERDLNEAIAAGIAALAEGTDVRAGVITAWLRLEDAAAEAGTPRRDDDAPGDLVGRVLAAHDVRPRRLQTLAELYRRARFSPAPLGERDRDEAQRALADVRADLQHRGTEARLGSGLGQPTAPGERWPTRWT